MSLDQPHQLLAAAVAVGTVLLALWIEGGLAAALVGAALTDLGLALVERRRAKNLDAVEVRDEDA